MSATVSTNTVALTVTPVRADSDAVDYYVDAPFTITNNGPNVIRVGDSTVTPTSGGQRVHVGDTWRKVLKADSAPVWIVTTTSTASVVTKQTAVFTAIGGGAVTSVAGRTGDITLANTDISGLGTASTHPATDFDAAGAAAAAAATEQTRALAAEALLAPLASPALAGTPTVPTAAPGTNTTQAASTAFVAAVKALLLTLTGGTMSGAIAMGANKITGAAAGTATTDVANVGQLSLVPVNTQASSYTLVLGDAGDCVELNNASANTLTVPTNASVAFPIGTVIEVCQYGAGQTTLTAAGGVTIRTTSSLTTRTQYSTVSLRKRATDEWIAAGDLT